MILLIIFVWWFIGTSLILWLLRGNITWGQLLFSFSFGVFGPLIPFIIIFDMLIEAQFWTKPIFKKKK